MIIDYNKRSEYVGLQNGFIFISGESVIPEYITPVLTLSQERLLNITLSKEQILNMTLSQERLLNITMSQGVLS